MNAFWVTECFNAMLSKANFFHHLRAGLIQAGCCPKCHMEAGGLWDLEFLEESGTRKQ